MWTRKHIQFKVFNFSNISRMIDISENIQSIGLTLLLWLLFIVVYIHPLYGHWVFLEIIKPPVRESRCATDVQDLISCGSDGILSFCFHNTGKSITITQIISNFQPQFWHSQSMFYHRKRYRQFNFFARVCVAFPQVNPFQVGHIVTQ